MLRWGIVGTGGIAARFAADAQHVDAACVAAVASRTQASADRFAARHGIDVACGSYASLYERDDVDAVYIATPHSFHLRDAADALRAGKAVLCEKPLTTSPDECRQLQAIAEASGCYLAEALWTWFLPAFRKARDWLAAGRIGELESIAADFGNPAPFDPESRLYAAELGGGCLLDLGIYPLAAARAFFAASPTHIEARALFAPNGVEDDLRFRLDYPQGRAELACSFRKALDNRAVIRGSKGHIELPDFWGATECRLYADGELVDRFSDGRRGSGLEFEIAAVSEEIAAGRIESEVVPLSASLALQEDMQRVRTAASAA